MKRSSVISSLAVFLIILPLPALAQTLIDQCQKIQAPGSYEVEIDLPSTGGLLTFGDCLKITVNSVSINLAGYTITGDGTVNRAGVNGNAGTRRIRVFGGNIIGFHTGIDLAASENVIVHDMQLLDNDRDGIVVGDHSVVAENVVSNDSATGALGTGITAGIGSRVADNLVSNNIRNGIVVKEDSAVLENNVRLTVGTDPGDAGISVICPSTVERNTVTKTSAEDEEEEVPRDIELIIPVAGTVPCNIADTDIILKNLGTVVTFAPGGPM